MNFNKNNCKYTKEITTFCSGYFFDEVGNMVLFFQFFVHFLNNISEKRKLVRADFDNMLTDLQSVFSTHKAFYACHKFALLF